jgi:copper chaperone
MGRSSAEILDLQGLPALDLDSVASLTSRKIQVFQSGSGKTMIILNVPDMSCGHCVGVIEKAVKGIDAGAGVVADLAAKTVKVETAAAASAIGKAVEAAGYPNSVL